MAEKSPSLATQAYHTIKENILNLTYPPGMVLTEAMLTKELEMSRSPVRTAIQMLQVEGLIVSDYYKSMTVKEITDKDINEIYQLRELLEGAAFRQIFTSGRTGRFLRPSTPCSPTPGLLTALPSARRCKRPGLMTKIPPAPIWRSSWRSPPPAPT